MSFALTSRDLEMLAHVASHRLLTSAHIQALALGSAQNILRRLHKLFHGGYLDRLRPEPTKDGGSEKLVYAITNKGLRALQKEGLVAGLPQTDVNENNRELHDLSIRHTLLVAHIRVVATLACRRHPDCRLTSWKEGRETYDAIEVALPSGYTRLPVAPDAVLSLRDAKGRMHFFLEADRGTMTVGRFTLKLLAYAAYHKERRQEEKFGFKYFRVLTVTSSDARARNLCLAAAEEEDLRGFSRHLLFTTEARLPLAEPASFFDQVWTVPHGSGPISILGSAPSASPQRKEDPPMRGDAGFG